VVEAKDLKRELRLSSEAEREERLLDVAKRRGEGRELGDQEANRTRKKGR
jgi:hypothetical protein